MARAADVVSVSTPGLRDRLAHLNPAIEVSANALDERLWQPRPARDAAIPGDRDPVRILYMGSRTHANDLRMIEDALAEIRARFGERVEIHCIGGVPGAPPAGIKAVRPPAGATRYPAFARWLSRTGGYDIALAPLEDSAFNATKSHIKYLDYALCGAAPVVSDVSAYRGTVRHGITGMMVDNSPRSWSAAIAQLVEEPELRRRIAVNAQEDVLAHHTLAAQAGSRAGFWRDILQRADGVSGRSAS
jgi:glycosyltransferase involved in cell wall biosynthesis